MGEKFKKVTHVIFDMDGLLLDTEKLYSQAIQTVLHRFNKIYDWEMNVSLMGMHHMDVCTRIVENYSLPLTPEEYSKLQRAENEKILCKAEFKPGAERLMRHLHATNVPICLATSSAEDMVQLKIANHREVFNLLSHRVCASTDPEVKEGKPAPDIFLIAASRFPDKPKPQQCLVFEDSPNGVMAACKACMQVVMVPDERVSVEQSCLATLRLKSLLDFKPEMFSLPPFPN
ncbi:pseudouridine 5'-phosphatase-like Gs1l [Glossina fuscipes fuscipes]